MCGFATACHGLLGAPEKVLSNFCRLFRRNGLNKYNTGDETVMSKSAIRSLDLVGMSISSFIKVFSNQNQ